MTTELLLQILLPAAISFLAGHFHLILPNPLKASSPFPTTIGHGEIISWLLSQLVTKQLPTPTPIGPTNPAAPNTTAAILAEILAIVKQALQAQAQQATAPQVPKPA